jgi:uncharacterized protein with ParB-like and HNH nuclease domain
MARRSNKRPPEREPELFENIQSEEEDRESSPPTYEILTYPADFTLEILVNKLRSKEIVIPKFQRRYVWKLTQASKLVESFLLGLPVPPIYLYAGQKGDMVLVDGQQRLRSIECFFDGYFGEDKSSKDRPLFRLTGLHPRSRFANKTYKELEETDDESYRKLNNAVLRSFVVKQLNPKDDTSIFHIFERLNSGGTSLQGQEIRNCIYPGSFNDLLHELNTFPLWRSIFGKKARDQRQRDTELILRFFALLNNRKHYEKPMKEFLNKYMAKNRMLAKGERDQFREIFKNTVERVHDNLGPKPFHIRRGLNAAVYDSVFIAFASHLGIKPIDAEKRFKELLDERDYNSAVSAATTDTEIVRDRIELASRFFFGNDKP